MLALTIEEVFKNQITHKEKFFCESIHMQVNLDVWRALGTRKTIVFSKN